MGCAAKSTKEKYTPPTQVNHKLSDWDYDKIRQVRETEDAMTPKEEVPSDTKDALKNCLVMSLADMKRSKSTGCRPIDPRLGNGEGAYCCPKIEASETN